MLRSQDTEEVREKHCPYLLILTAQPGQWDARWAHYVHCLFQGLKKQSPKAYSHLVWQWGGFNFLGLLSLWGWREQRTWLWMEKPKNSTWWCVLGGQGGGSGAGFLIYKVLKNKPQLIPACCYLPRDSMWPLQVKYTCFIYIQDALWDKHPQIKVPEVRTFNI